MKASRLLLLPLAFFVLSFLVACGGDKKDSGSGDSVDLSKASSKLEELKSFRFDMVMKLDLGSSSSTSAASDDELGGLASLLLGAFGDIKMEGAFVSPDKAEMKMSFGKQEFGAVQIGKKQWVRLMGDWEASDSSDELSFGSAPTEIFEGLLPADVLKGAKTKSETVNGQKTTRYTFDKKALEQVAKDLGEGTVDFKEVTKADLSVWLTSEEVPVKIAMFVSGKDDKGKDVSMKLDFNVKDINGNIQIKAPI